MQRKSIVQIRLLHRWLCADKANLADTELFQLVSAAVSDVQHAKIWMCHLDRWHADVSCIRRYNQEITSSSNELVHSREQERRDLIKRPVRQVECVFIAVDRHHREWRVRRHQVTNRFAR